MSADCEGMPLPPDALLNVLAHLNVVDLARTSAVSRRMLYMVDRLQIDIVGAECVGDFARAPSLCVKSGGDNGGAGRRRQRKRRKSDCLGKDQSIKEVFPRALAAMRTRPTLALGYARWSSAMPSTRSAVQSSLGSFLPPDCSVLVTYSDDIQANCHGCVESDTDFSVLLASFANASLVPFNFAQSDEEQYSGVRPMVETLLSQLRDATPSGSKFSAYWKTFFLYGTVSNKDQFLTEGFLYLLQSAFPDSTICGGICNCGQIRRPHRKECQRSASGRLRRSLLRRRNPSQEKGFTLVDSGLFGIAIGGDAPVCTVVSRGIRSLTSSGSSITGFLPSSKWIISDINSDTYSDPVTALTWFSHSIKRVQNTETNESLSGRDWIARLLNGRLDQALPVYCGIKVPKKERGQSSESEWWKMHHAPDVLDNFYDFAQPVPMVGKEVDIFELDARICLEDAELSLDHLQASLKGQRILGGLMISCNQRGPRGGDAIFDEDMVDAMQLYHRFPDVPCIGFYALGEIGPDAVLGRQSMSQSGQAWSDLQGYTAVFAFFVMPTETRQNHCIDDSPESLKEYMMKRMQKT